MKTVLFVILYLFLSVVIYAAWRALYNNDITDIAPKTMLIGWPVMIPIIAMAYLIAIVFAGIHMFFDCLVEFFEYIIHKFQSE